LLQDYCNGLLYDNPESWLKSDDVSNIEKPMFISILKKDDLGLREIDSWDCVIRWGMGQIKNLKQTKKSEESKKENILEWNKDDLKELKNLLDNVMPLIRFNQITPTEFHKEVEPYKRIIDEKL